MLVIDRKNLEIIEVPDDYRECSICLAWKPESDFKNEGEEHVSRTNCRACYKLPYDVFKKSSDAASAYRVSLTKDGRLRMTMRALSTELKIRKNGITKDKLREYFADILQRIPDDALIDVNGGDIEVEQAIAGKPLFELKFSNYADDSGYWG